MKSTRDRILQTLLTHPRATINELAEAVNINAISVRHHLSNLQADGLVLSEEERHGVGRPRLIYYLTEKGVEQFPSRYYSLTNRLLEQLKDNIPSATLHMIFANIGNDLIEEHLPEIEAMDTESRLDFIKELLASEGHLLEWEKQEAGYNIYENTCPYYHISQNHPEVCNLDQTLLSRILETPVEKITCIHQGDARCTYTTKISPKGETQI
jgi:DeoR family transcriptional regulator, suf operon transcriptional repressor